MKDAEIIETSDDFEEKFNYLSDSAKQYTKDICNKISGFSLEKFKTISSKVLECVIKANDEQNNNDIKKFLSKDLAEIVCSSFETEEKNHIILVSLNYSIILDVVKDGSIYDIIVEFQMEQINYTTNKDNEVIDGSKSEVIKVNEKWYFSHDFSKKDSTWFVRKIEEL